MSSLIIKAILFTFILTIISSCQNQIVLREDLKYNYQGYNYNEKIDFIPKDIDLKWNYEIIDRIIKNPDSLDVIFRNPANTLTYCFDNHTEELSRLEKMIIEKIKNNDFKNGYTIIDEDVLYNGYYWHSLIVASNKTGKRICFEFGNSRKGIWTILDIHTIIISQDSILEY
jgi:hypothetical protein